MIKGDSVKIVDEDYLREHNRRELVGKALTIANIGVVYYGDALVSFEETSFKCFLSRLAPAAEPTDQELADEFRASRKRASEIAVILQEKGFRFSSKRPEEALFTPARFTGQEITWSIKKIVTVEPVITEV